MLKKNLSEVHSFMFLLLVLLVIFLLLNKTFLDTRYLLCNRLWAQAYTIVVSEVSERPTENPTLKHNNIIVTFLADEPELDIMNCTTAHDKWEK